jgi:hypothetical protein
MSRDSIDGQPLLPTASASENLEYYDEKPSRSWRRTALLVTSVALNVIFILRYVFELSPYREVGGCPPQVYCKLELTPFILFSSKNCGQRRHKTYWNMCRDRSMVYGINPFTTVHHRLKSIRHGKICIFVSSSLRLYIACFHLNFF